MWNVRSEPASSLDDDHVVLGAPEDLGGIHVLGERHQHHDEEGHREQDDRHVVRGRDGDEAGWAWVWMGVVTSNILM